MIKNNYARSLVVPLDLLQDQDLSQSQKLVLSLIIQLDNDMGCYATNDYLAGFLGISGRQIQKHIKSLIENHYLPKPLYRLQKVGNKEQTLRVFKGVSKMTSLEQKGNLGVSKSSPKGIEERINIFLKEVNSEIEPKNDFEKEELKKFLNWWTEKTRNKKKFRQEKQDTWETKKRWSTWMSGKIEKPNKPKPNNYTDITKYKHDTTGKPMGYCSHFDMVKVDGGKKKPKICGQMDTYMDVYDVRKGSRCHSAVVVPTKPKLIEIKEKNVPGLQRV
jgi:hypothetical protein